MATEKYEYAPLSEPREIRLINIHPGATPGDPELSVDLVPTSLDAAPPFQALSYTWGDPLPRKRILCGGRPIEIGPSLHSALLALRLSVSCVWADALCINQEDIPEREAQVRLMGDIYETASSTFVWLGEDNDQITSGLIVLGKFGGVMLDHEKPLAATTEQHQAMLARFSAHDDLESRVILEDAFGDVSTQSMAFGWIWNLLRQPWFTRKWVIQEIIKSLHHDTSIYLLCGNIAVEYRDFNTWFGFLEMSRYAKAHFFASYPHGLEDGTFNETDAWADYGRGRTLAAIDLPDPPLSCLLARTVTFKCTDSRDHTIALLGIAGDCLEHQDLIDYNTSAEDLYRRLTCSYLDSSSDLRVIWSFSSIIPVEKRVSGSWIPNLEELASTNLGSLVPIFSQLPVPHRLANASGSTALHATTSGNNLLIRGRILDSVKLLGTDMTAYPEVQLFHNFEYSEDFQRVLARIDQWMDECHTIARSANKDEDCLTDSVLIENLLELWTPEGLEGITAVKKHFIAYRQFLKALVAATNKTAWRQAYEGHDVEILRTIHDFLEAMVSRRFGCTRDGSLGWLPLVAERGDQVCVFDGMEFPYVIRKGPGANYLLVGECYLSNLMDGEAMDLPGVESEIITLE